MSSHYDVFFNDGKCQIVERFVYGDYEIIIDLAITKMGFHAYVCTQGSTVEWTCSLTTRQDAIDQAKEFVDLLS
jgi:hypothetical protein